LALEDPDGLLITCQEQFFQPAQDSVDNTMQWLGDVGIPRQDTRLQKGRGLLRFSATVQQMYELLGDNHDLLRRHMVSEDPLQETEHLVPRHLRKHIDSIEVKAVRSPKVQARDLASKHKPPYKIEVAPDLTNCSLSWTPACIRRKPSLWGNLR
jgi:tripeptidyl-peptidase-1